MVQNAPRLPNIGAIILAAGASKRMGQPKQLLPIEGQPMLRRVAEVVCASGVVQVVVVIGSAADRIAKVVSGLSLTVLRNPLWVEGISTSLQAGIGALEANIEAALVVLADHPLITTVVIDQIIECYVESGAAAVVPTHKGRWGHPVLLDRSLFPDVLRLEGDHGARSLLNRPGTNVLWLEVDDACVVQDVDTLEEYAAVQRGNVR